MVVRGSLISENIGMARVCRLDVNMCHFHVVGCQPAPAKYEAAAEINEDFVQNVKTPCIIYSYA
jgi:hypothetical protein